MLPEVCQSESGQASQEVRSAAREEVTATQQGGAMKRRIFVLGVLMGLPTWPLGHLATDVWADDGDSAALKADIEVLKQRLAQLESQVGGGTFTGTTGIGEKGGPALIELPSGL